MRSIEQRLEKLEEVLGDNRCVCGDRSPMRAGEILVIEDDWDEKRIRMTEASKQIACPVHGRWSPLVLCLCGSDVFG